MGNGQGRMTKKALCKMPIIYTRSTVEDHVVEEESGEEEEEINQPTFTRRGFGGHCRTAPALQAQNKTQNREGERRGEDNGGNNNDVINSKVTFVPGDLYQDYYFELAYQYKEPKLSLANVVTSSTLCATIALQKALVSVAKGAIDRSIEGNMKIVRVGRKRKGRTIAVRCDELLYDNTHSLRYTGKRVVKISENIAFMSSLTCLDLSNNELSKLPDQIGCLKSLSQLNVSGNRLEKLPETIGCLYNLSELNVENNRLSSLPRTIGQLYKLKSIVITRNQIQVVPREVGLLLNLVSFEARCNNIEWLPAEMSLLKHLRTILLDNNPLVKEESINSKQNKITTMTGPSSLLELASRSIVRESAMVYVDLPLSLKMHLKKAEECIFCRGPYIDSLVGRLRILTRFDQQIPFMYHLCCSHWDDERGRLRALFVEPPETASKRIVELKRSGSIQNLNNGLPFQKKNNNEMIKTRKKSKELPLISVNAIIPGNSFIAQHPKYNGRRRNLTGALSSDNQLYVSDEWQAHQTIFLGNN